jgi:hypothetical protein
MLPQNILIVNGTGVLHNAEPGSRTLALKGETCHGGKKYKDRLNVLLPCAHDVEMSDDYGHLA